MVVMVEVIVVVGVVWRWVVVGEMWKVMVVLVGL